MLSIGISQSERMDACEERALWSLILGCEKSTATEEQMKKCAVQTVVFTQAVVGYWLGRCSEQRSEKKSADPSSQFDSLKATESGTAGGRGLTPRIAQHSGSRDQASAAPETASFNP